MGIFLFIFVALYPIFLHTLSLGMGYIGIIWYRYIYSKRNDTWFVYLALLDLVLMYKKSALKDRKKLWKNSHSETVRRPVSVIKKVHNFLRVSEIYMSYFLLKYFYSTHASSLQERMDKCTLLILYIDIRY